MGKMVRRKVYIVNRGMHDYSGAEEFGEIIYMTEGVQNRTAMANMVRMFRPIIRKSNKMDYIVISSLSTMVAVACVLFVIKHRRLNVLLFDAKESIYLVRELLFDDDFADVETTRTNH